MKREPVAVVGGLRIPFDRSFHAYKGRTNLFMLTQVLNAMASRFKLEGAPLGEVCAGAVYKHAGDFGLTREAVLHSHLSPLTPGVDTQRACGTSLEATLNIANKIAMGQIEIGIAGGSDTNSESPLEFSRHAARKFLLIHKAKTWRQRASALLSLRPKDFLPAMPGIREPSSGLLMGEHCELMAKEWAISRQEQDAWALASHQKAAAGYEKGFFDDLVVPFASLSHDTIVRPQTSMEKLAALPTAFDPSSTGSLTAGNSSPLSDGAAAVLLASKSVAEQRKLPILAYFVDAQIEAVDFPHGEGLLMAPTIAVSKLLDRHGLTLQDFDFYEIHEAFAAQVLCTLKAWEDPQYCERRLGKKAALGSIDRAKINVYGGSVALGHPFAATGARLVATLAKLLNEKGSGRGLISVCTAGGMGMAAILQTTAPKY